jgi:transposase IS116/IS110/IS902 family protein
MLGVVDHLELTDLVNSITGVSVAGAAAILAQSWGRRRFATARALVKHAGLALRQTIRHIRRPHQTHRTMPTRTPPGSLAGGLGSSTRQPPPAAA